MFFQEQVW